MNPWITVAVGVVGILGWIMYGVKYMDISMLGIDIKCLTDERDRAEYATTLARASARNFCKAVGRERRRVEKIRKMLDK